MDTTKVSRTEFHKVFGSVRSVPKSTARRALNAHRALRSIPSHIMSHTVDMGDMGDTSKATMMLRQNAARCVVAQPAGRPHAGEVLKLFA